MDSTGTTIEGPHGVTVTGTGRVRIRVNDSVVYDADPEVA